MEHLSFEQDGPKKLVTNFPPNCRKYSMDANPKFYYEAIEEKEIGPRHLRHPPNPIALKLNQAINHKTL